MVAIAVVVLLIFIPVGVFLLIKGIRQGDEVDVYNTSGKMYIGLAIFAIVFALGLAIFCFSQQDSGYDYDNSYNNSYQSNSNSSSGGSSSSTGSFTNKFGTRTTKCVVSGCNNYIARSGDTNCCISHSNKCLECHCYIDGDAMYCMSCITGAVAGNSSNSNSAKSCYVCGDSAYTKYGSYYYCSECLALVKAFSE